MRIIIVCTYYPYPPSVGGVETIVRQTARELTKRGHEVHIVSSTYDVTTQKPVTSPGVEEREGVTIHKLESIPVRIGYARILKGLRETIEKIKPHIIHIHNLHPSLFQLAKWKEKSGYKLVAELHHPEACAEKLSTKLMLPLVMLVLSIKYSNTVDVFIAHTTLEHKWLMKWKINYQRITIIHFPAIPDDFPNNYTNIKMRIKRKNIILFLGRVVKRKGVEILLKAFSKIADAVNARLTIAGPIEPKYLRYLERIIEKHRLTQYVNIKGFIPEEEKYNAIASSKMLVLPSYREYTPITLLEAQALGTPVVATKVGAIPEIVKDKETGILIRPGDVDELAEVLETLLTNNRLWKRMSFRAREWAKRFTLSKAVDELEKLYSNLAESHRIFTRYIMR